MLVQVLTAVSPLHKVDIEKAVSSQTILTAEQAKDWNLVQTITDQIMPPGASFIAINSGTEPSKDTKFQVITPSISIISPEISATQSSPR